MELSYYSNLFKILSDDTRLKICQIVSCGEICACDILKELNISQSTLSYHMKILCDSGITTGRKDCQWMRYKINKENFEKIIEFLKQILCDEKDKSIEKMNENYK